ncbi:MAG: signal recognition particle-docking protein FtsY [Thermodesulfobacteriota bacterium]
MFDWLIETYNAIPFERIFEYIGQIHETATTTYPAESVGIGAVVLLLMTWRRIRKRREKIRQIQTAAESAFEEKAKARRAATEESPAGETEAAGSETAASQQFASEAEAAEADKEKAPEPAAAQAEAPLPEPEPETPANLMNRLKSGLGKTRRSLSGRLETIFSDKKTIDDETLEKIEEALITSDVGVDTTMELIKTIEENAGRLKSSADLRELIKSEMRRYLIAGPPEQRMARPYVIMVVGVNGVGKTTTIGKIAHKYAAEGNRVLIGAADTFRAAAVEQLEIWAGRANADIVKHRENADPAAVAYDSIEAAISRQSDIVIIDTAGRLHTKVNLMEQLKKIKRSIGKKMPEAPHEVMLVLDATTGQNAVSQARLFSEGIGVNSLVLTKLDGTAKGGIVVSICHTMKLPLRYIGVGETIEDLQPFDPERFVDALF